MRILQVRFKNLNSLAGEWEIDLTDPAFLSDGIFAITGPTGAGKTTILDAVCLALYGRTPRLSRVNKGGNDIMSRQTGECYAEVTFETQAGRYRCHWYQRKARKSAEGDLQPPKHEISDADSGKIVESKIRGVAGQIEAATGMDFDRFTRSMLLAQGSFAAFLQAGPDQRSPILEQITGTEIYSEISKRVHERRSQEHKQLDTLSDQLAGMQVLAPEEGKRLKDELEQKNQIDAEQNSQIGQTREAVAWLDGMERLGRELKLVGEQKEDWESRRSAFGPDHERLRRATQALELAGDHAGLVSMRGEQERDRQGYGECQEELPTREAAVKLAEGAQKRAGEDLEEKRTEQRESVPVIRRVRELALKIGEKEAPIKDLDDAVGDLEKALEDLRSRQEEGLVTLAGKRAEQRETEKHLEENRTDEGLVEQFAGIRERFVSVKSLQERQEGKLEEVALAEEKKCEADGLWKEQAQNLETLQIGLESSRNAFGQKQTELRDLLENREIAEWRESISSLTERGSFLEEIGEAVAGLADSRKTLGELDKRYGELLAEKTDIIGRLQVQGEKLASLERERELLETQFSLATRIQNLEEARHQLRDGEPCPLCGALEHPFAEGNLPVPDETLSALRQVKADLKTVTDTVAALKVEEAEAAKDIGQIVSRKEECSAEIEESETLTGQGCEGLSIDGSDPELGDTLSRLAKENADSLGHAKDVVRDAEAMEKEMGVLRESIDHEKDVVAQAERETQAAVHNRESARQLLERLTEEAGNFDSDIMEMMEALRQDLSVYGIEEVVLEDLDRVKEELTARRDVWVERQKEKSELDRQIAASVIETGNRSEQILKSESELKGQRDRLCGLRSERDDLSKELRELFGDRDPDDEEARLSLEVEGAEKSFEGSRETLNAATWELVKLTDRIDELDKTMAARVVRLQEAEGVFLERLDGLGFADEESYAAACLPENERKELMERARMLSDEKTGFDTREREKTEQLEKERQKKVTDRPRDELDEVLNGLLVGHEALLKEIGGIRQKLEDNESLKRQQQEQTKAIEDQRRECSRWDMLHELIGSADGKKYRNFAQGLTFEMMIGHANRQLRKMTDRYLLIRDETQSLELNVIDNYQAGEIRSTKNLSGGESFIVSLALALGLSKMASKNVRVDSLFLDEGFGSLDEEALDTALETLAGLQQDGKLIGVISHVPALKERIGTRIEVIPRRGGRSVISGPGCGAVETGADS